MTSSHKPTHPRYAPCICLSPTDQTAFSGVVVRVSLYTLVIMSSRFLYHQPFHFLFLRGWAYCSLHPSYSFRLHFRWYGGIFDYRIYFMRYEIGISKLPF